MGKNSIIAMREISKPKYRGKHLIMVAGKIFTARTAKAAVKIFERVTKKYRNQTPTITYVPKADTLILWRG